MARGVLINPLNRDHRSRSIAIGGMTVRAVSGELELITRAKRVGDLTLARSHARTSERA